MASNSNIPEIIEVKDCLTKLQEEKLLKTWELPYENLFTRRSATVFFLTPKTKTSLKKIIKGLEQFENFSCRENTEKKFSDMEYRITFSEEEKFKNEELLNPKEVIINE